MNPPKKIVNFLEKQRVRYKILEHKTVYTSFDRAKTLKVPEKTVGKTLALKLGNNLILVLIRADKNLDFARLKKAAKKNIAFSGGKLDLASEKLIKNRFKGIKLGVIPPFGPLWKLVTFVDRDLLKAKEVILNAGSYNFSIKIRPAELKKIIPDLILGDFSRKK